MRYQEAEDMLASPEHIARGQELLSLMSSFVLAHVPPTVEAMATSPQQIAVQVFLAEYEDRKVAVKTIKPLHEDSLSEDGAWPLHEYIWPEYYPFPETARGRIGRRHGGLLSSSEASPWFTPGVPIFYVKTFQYSPRAMTAIAPVAITGTPQVHIAIEA